MPRKLNNKIEEICYKKGVKMTQPRIVIAQVISESDDHPDANEIYERVRKIDDSIGIATVYRAIKTFCDVSAIEKHNFSDGKHRYEIINDDDHHDHLIDIDSGEVLEFFNEELEKLKDKIAQEHGYEMIDHRLEIYGRKIKK